MVPCRVERVFDAQEAKGEERHRPDRRVGQPGEGAAQSEGHTGGGRQGASHPEPADQGVGGHPGERLQQHLHDQHPLVEGQDQDEGEEGAALHLAGQGRPDPLVGVPPRDVPVQPVEGGQVPQRLGGVAGIGIDVGDPRQPPGLGRRQVGVEDEGVGRDQMEEGGPVGDQDRDPDAGERHDVCPTCHQSNPD